MRVMCVVVDMSLPDEQAEAWVVWAHVRCEKVEVQFLSSLGY